MKRNNLTYNIDHKLIVCMKHDYCLFVNSLKHHLRAIHAVKDERLHATLTKIETLNVKDSRQIHLLVDALTISHLTIDTSYRSDLTACKQNTQFVNKHKRAIEKHLSKEHDIDHVKSKIKFAAINIEVVCVQFLFSRLYYDAFAVVKSIQTSTINLSAIFSSHAEFASRAKSSLHEDFINLENQYRSNQEQWQQSFDRFLSNDDQYIHQTSSWIRSIDINRWVQTLSIEKKNIWELVHAIHSSKNRCFTISMRTQTKLHAKNSKIFTIENLIEQIVVRSLINLRAKTTSRVTITFINRIIDRIFNSFEENRMQFKIFTSVQETSIMNRYASLWSDLLLFLLKLIEDDECCSVLSTRYFRNFRILKDCMNNIQRIKEDLLAVNTQQLSLEDCLSVFDLEKNSKESSKSLSTHANDFINEIDRMSFVLIRYRWDEFSFVNSIIDFVALHIINEEDVWIRAQNFFSRLSDWIHCMQLLLLNHCFKESRTQQASFVNMKELIRKECDQFLKNFTFNSIVELSWWRLLSWIASNDFVRHSIIIVNEDCTLINHKNVEFHVATWRHDLHAMLESINQICEKTLLFNLHETSKFRVDDLIDNLVDIKSKKFFFDESRNDLDTIRDWLFERLHAILDLTVNFFKIVRDVKLVREFVVNDYLLANQKFLRLMSMLIYWIFDLSSRRKKIADIAWCNNETARNLFISHDLMILIIEYHKSQWRIETRSIARFLTFAIDQLLIKYLIYVSFFVQFLHVCMQFLLNREFLFWDRDHVWSTNKFESEHKRQSAQLLSCVMITRDYQHIAIDLNRRVLREKTSKLYEISQHFEQKTLHAENLFDSKLNEFYDDDDLVDMTFNSISKMHSWQTSHTTFTNQINYDNDVDLHARMIDSLLAIYRQVNQNWHRLIAQLSSLIVIASNHKRLSSRDSFSMIESIKRHRMSFRFKVRRELWKWSIIEIELQRIFESHAESRSLNQRNDLIMIARSRLEIIVVMLTSDEKSLLFVVSSQLSSAQVTMIIVFLIALKQNLLRRCMKWNVICACYDLDTTSQQMHAVFSLLLMNIETTITSNFVSFARFLHATNRLNRIVLDEAHLLLIASHYRSRIVELNVLRRVFCSLICMTITLSSFVELKIKKLLHFTQCDILRASSDKLNLKYCVQSLTSTNDDSCDEKELIEQTIEICMQNIVLWNIMSIAREICYVRLKIVNRLLTKSLSCEFYHEKLSSSQRDELIIAWSQRLFERYIIVTTTFKASVHYFFVRKIVHVDALDELVNYEQEIDRAERDELHAVCLTLLLIKWKVSWNSNYQSDFLTRNRKKMTRYLRARICLRRHLIAI